MKTSLCSTSFWKHQGVAMLGIAALLTLCGPSRVYAQLSASDIAAMKQEITKQKYTFTVDENPATKIPLSQLCGTIPALAPNSANSLSSKTMVGGTDLPSYWDWRQHNGVTPVKNQGNCGSCWAFSTVGTMEAMILIASGTTTDLSEQQLVSCNTNGWSCDGGNYAFDMEISPGAMLESCFAYQAADVACQSGCPHVYQLSSWGYVGNSWSVPSTTAIKNAIYTYGPISVEVAVDGYFQAYSGGVFNNNSASSLDHAVVLVGWDDTNGCWIMKNSWGTGWGESGYMRIAYGCDQIGYGAAYAVWVLPEPLKITPATGFTSTGGVGGPFTITSQSLSLTNLGTNSLTWMLANTSVWLNASPSGGTLTPGGSATTVTVSLNSAASNLVVGTYSVTVWFTNLNSGVGQGRQFTLAVISPPTITVQPGDQAVLEGAAATFTVAATGGLPLYYQWQDNGTNLTDGGNISGSTTTNLIIGTVSAANVGTYSVIVSNAAGVATSSNALLTITPSPPVITMQPMAQTAVVGETVTFTVTAIGSTPFFYQWIFNGTNISNATNASLVLANVQLNQAGSNYMVVITNAYGSTNSSNATLNVYTVPVITSFSPQFGAAGTVLNISGLNFDPTPGNNIVYFGAVQAAVTVASVTNLMVTVPAGATYAPITETVNGLTAYANNPFLPTFPGSGALSSSSMSGPTNLTVGSGPIIVVIADLDGDGKPDLIVANDYGNTISLYRNISTNGSLTAGSFASRVDLVTPPGNASPWGLAVADVDGDGKLDIVVSDYDESIVSVYRNQCSPGSITTNSFATRVDFPVGTGPTGVAVQDLDGDGKPEIVTANYAGTTVSVLRNLGTMGSITTNSFAPAVSFTVGPTPVNVMIADVDGDGKADVVTVNNGNSSQAMSVLRNLSTLGNIAFATNVDFPGLPTSYCLAIGDLDGDGKPDVVIGSQPDGQSVSVYRNTSTPGSITTNSFAAHVDFAAGGWANSVAIGDLDGDGKPDVAVVTQLPDHLSLFKNVSVPGSFTTNSFAARVDFAAGSNPNGVAIGDLDGDGRPDVAFGNCYSGTISIYRNVVPLGGPPVITTQPTNQTVAVGGTATFTAVASGSLPLSYQWSFGETNIAGATNTSLTLTNVQLSQAGNYAVTVTNIYGSVLSSNAVLTVNPPPPCALVSSGMVSWWSAEGNANDVAGTNNGTLVGGASFAAGEVGQAFSFDGSSGYVSIPDSPSLDSFTTSITIELWLKVNQLTANSEWKGIVTKGDSSWRLQGTTWAKSVTFSLTGVNPNMDLMGSRNVNDGQWHHVAAVYDGTNMFLYVDGTLDVSQPATGSIVQDSYPVCLGENAQMSGRIFNGLIDEMSLYNRALTASEVQAIYAAGSGGKCPLNSPAIYSQPTNQMVAVGGTAIFSVLASGTPPLSYQWNFDGTNIVGATNTTLTLTNVQLSQAGNYAVTVTNIYGSTNSAVAVLTVNPLPPCAPVSSGMVSWWSAEGNADDIVGVNNGTLVGGASFVAGEVGQAFSFDGSSGYVSIPDSASLNAFTTSLTIELWLKVNQLTANSGWVGIVTKGNTSWRLQGTSWANTVYLGLDGVSPSRDLYGTRNVNDGQWHHVAAVYDGTNMFLYVDGTLDVSQPATGMIAQNSSPVCLGGNAQMSGGIFNGLIDEVSLYNRALAASEIQAIYAAGSGGKCYTPTAPAIYSQPTNQVMYVGFTAAFSAMASGTPPLSYQWNLNGTNIVGATNTTLTLTNVQLSQAGNYAVTVTNVYGSVLSSNAVLTVNPLPPCAPVSSGLVSWWSAEGNADDIVGVNNGTLVDDAGFALGEVGQAFSCDGSSGYVSIPDSASLDSFTTSITIELWLKVNQLTANSGWVGIVTKGNTSWRLQGTSWANTVYLGLDGVSPSRDLYGTRNVNDGQWHHVAAVYDGTNMFLYVDGTLDVSQPATGMIAQNSSPVCLGGNAQMSGGIFNGLIDEVSLYNRALTVSEIQAIYAVGSRGKCPLTLPVIDSQPTNQVMYVGFTVTFSVVAIGPHPLSYQWNLNGTNIVGATNTTLTLTNVQLSQAGNYAVTVTNVYGSTNSAVAVLTVNPLPPCASVSAGMVSWWSAEGNADDIVGVNNGTLENGAGFALGEVGQAFSFDGSSGYVSIPDSASLDSFTTSITIELWFKVNQLTANSDWMGIVTKGNSSWRLMGTAGANTVYLGLNGVSPSGDLYGTRNVNDGQWHHVAAVYDGTNMFLYVDGTLDVSQPATGSISQNSYPVYIGQNAEASMLSFNGLIDEVSLYNRALTASEIQAIYAAGSGGKCYGPTPPGIILQPTNQVVTVGGTTTFNVVAGGTPPLSFQWNFNGTNIVGATNTTLTLTNVQLSQAGNYAVTVTNVYGSVLSSNAVLTVTLDHFTWSTVPSPRFVNIPFAVVIQARDLTNGLFTNFTGTAILGTTNGVTVTPPVSGNFIQGVWTGAVVISQTASNLVLRADDGLGHFGLANPINVISLPRLGMLHSGNIALYMWPVGYPGFVLETSGNLSPATWVVVPYSPIQIGDQYLLPLDMTGTNGFYRLWFPGP